MIKRMVRRWLGLEEKFDPNTGELLVKQEFDGRLQAEPDYYDEIRNQEGGLQFTIYPAQGGRIVQVRSYDDRKDRNHSTLHIITADEDFGEQINQIYMQEKLTRGG